MNSKILHQIYAGHVGKVNHKRSIYMDEYDHLFSICLNKLVRFIEIGIQNGGLLEICMKYLGNASVLIRHGFNQDFVCSAYGDSRAASLEAMSIPANPGRGCSNAVRSLISICLVTSPIRSSLTFCAEPKRMLW